MESLRKKTAIVGIGETELGKVPGKSLIWFYIEAARLAMEDAGLTKEDVDGVLVHHAMWDRDVRMHAKFTEHMNMFAKTLHDTLMTGGMSPGYAIQLASWAILAGQCKNVLVVGGDMWTSGAGRSAVGTEAVGAGMTLGGHSVQYEFPYGSHIPALYAQVASRHMHEYGLTSEQLAAVAVACRKHAALNPKAYKKDPITIEDVLNSRMVATPFHMLDCSLISDGGGAFIVSSAERAKDLKKPPVWVLGVGQASSFYHVGHLATGSKEFNLTHTVAKLAGERAFAEAGVTPKDIDVAELYDSFTMTVITQLEDYGFCGKGEGGPFVEGGRIELGGELPVNTHGGLLSCAHPGMPAGWFHLIEAVRQMRGEAGARQVKHGKLAFVGSVSGTISNFSATILGRD